MALKYQFTNFHCKILMKYLLFHLNLNFSGFKCSLGTFNSTISLGVCRLIPNNILNSFSSPKWETDTQKKLTEYKFQGQILYRSSTPKPHFNFSPFNHNRTIKRFFIPILFIKKYYDKRKSERKTLFPDKVFCAQIFLSKYNPNQRLI